MNEELKSWKIKSGHEGIFGQYIVHGFHYESEAGELAWHTTSWPNDNPIHDFWLTDGEFHAVSGSIFHNMTYETRIEIGGIIHNVNPAERRAILDAIAQWEAEDTKIPRM